jgi:hypothetical protein
MKSLGSKIGLIIFFLMTSCLWANSGRTAVIEPFHWGLTVEELNQVLAKERSADSILREDPSRSAIVLPYTSLKSLKIQGGRIKALVEVKKGAGPESIGRLFGYVCDGRLFGRVELFRYTPGASPTEITRRLKESFPEGKIVRSFGGSSTVSSFEYRRNDLYVFTNEDGVYYFEPLTLNKVIREELKILGEKESKMQDETREQLRTP